MWDLFTVDIVCRIHYSLGYIIHSDTGSLARYMTQLTLVPRLIWSKGQSLPIYKSAGFSPYSRFLGSVESQQPIGQLCNFNFNTCMQWTLSQWGGSKVSTNWSNTWKHACYCVFMYTFTEKHVCFHVNVYMKAQ